ncbi:hypothetical protein LZP97_26935 (plasmid) [Rhodococcus sp. DMF-1]|uniref:DUF7172 family protein n=1 Tax=Rhodococcus TaxID=1827 RepID=UPI00128C8489|nr:MULTISPECIES: hypothetical protein [Rhodococcus]UIR36973.1 hypothetical protein LZP97_25905 [Rhodococcus sp. DMF-1]UIR37008.1 hypothetical protein LZP97_00070 [Rhodococcus sp. DMF-1]UIR39822.1 hypothetical protein LZP97_26935 [Rhodococcus sp. DMF-1]
MICSSRQFTHSAAGVMGLSMHALPRQVAVVQSDSGGDGELKYPDDQGRVLVDQELHWANTYPCPVRVLPVIKRRSRLLHTTGSVLLVVRERVTWFVGQDREQRVQAADPDPTAVFDSEWGGGDTVGSAATGSAVPRTYSWLLDPETVHLLPFVTVPQDRSISLRLRIAAWFRHYVADNAEADINEVWVRGNTLSLLAFPAPEETT